MNHKNGQNQILHEFYISVNPDKLLGGLTLSMFIYIYIYIYIM